MKYKRHGLSKHSLHAVWMLMKQRCYNPKATGYCNYGGRGVEVCDEWKNDFKAFYDWAIGNNWQYGLDLDKDIKGNGMLYSPDNCVFVTTKENCNNTRDNTYFIVEGIQLSMATISNKFNISYTTLRARMRRGWNILDAINKPVRKFSKAA